ncbi:MAG: glucose-1-phosphate cytidylyltransferase [Planctomycetaceae bacterium]|jgi:glucose-1-phosphate cytidylyltransferase|nr:glucose-1-phosphate cytidylyltransferase [Planctomycetaceae bacterium]
MIKVVILAGGFGTRFAEETDTKPKPMITLGGFPILWHIMKYFAEFSYDNFYIATGYKGDVIKTYFTNYHRTCGSVMVDLATGDVTNYSTPPEQWKVHLIETGLTTQTGGRIRRMEKWLRGSEPFFATYGDGLANVDLNALLEFHKSHGKIATVTAVRPPARYGVISFDNSGTAVMSFNEKPQTSEGWINGGFFVFNEQIFDYIKNDNDAIERDGLEKIVADGELMAFRHEGFWQCMDTLRDKIYLENCWNNNKALWKIWNDHPERS